MPDLRYVWLDVFTATPLTGGSPLAVFPEAATVPPELLQPLAHELNLSETAYLYPAEAGGTARMRIFTPTEELGFAGLPTMGAAAYLAVHLGVDLVRLETPRGIVPVEMERRPAHVRGWMEQPLPAISDWPDPDALFAALGVPGSVLPLQRYDNGVPHVFVMLESVDAVMALRPRADALRDVCGGTRLNCFAGEADAYTTRMFRISDTVFEDPATGSAAGPLAAHLVRHGVVRSGTPLTISQGAAVNRPSTLLATADVRDGEVVRVRVGGDAVLVGQGSFSVGD